MANPVGMCVSFRGFFNFLFCFVLFFFFVLGKVLPVQWWSLCIESSVPILLGLRGLG